MSGKVRRQDFIVWAAARVRGAIQTYAQDKEHALYSSSLTLRDFLSGTDPYLDLDLPRVQTLLTAWVALGGITQLELEDLLALAETSASLDVADGVTVVVKGLIPGVGIGEVFTRRGDKFIGPGTHWASAPYVIAHPDFFGLN